MHAVVQATRQSCRRGAAARRRRVPAAPGWCNPPRPPPARPPQVNPFKAHRIDPPATTVTATKDELLQYFKGGWEGGSLPALGPAHPPACLPASPSARWCEERRGLKAPHPAAAPRSVTHVLLPLTRPPPELYRLRRMEISADMLYKAKQIRGFCHL